MEGLETFISNGNSYGSGSGYGSGYGDGYGNGNSYGDGYGNGNGYGNGDGSGYGSGDGYGNGNGNGYGNGDGSGYGSGSGSGYGDGSGYGSGYGIESINNWPVVLIDGIRTVVCVIKKNVAKGYILKQDLTMEPCFVVKQNNLFAHGTTLREANQSLQSKIFETLDVELKIKLFNENFNHEKKYPAMLFFEWHNKLTGSCDQGRRHFASQHGIDLDKDKFTVAEFIKLTKNSYGGEIIKKLTKDE